jgi:hypothetical protein
MAEQVKRRVIVVDDKLVPRLVQILEEELSIDQEMFDIAEDTGHSTEGPQARIKEVRDLLNAVGPKECPYCDDNQGRTDGRGCVGCNLIALVDDNEVREIAAEKTDALVEDLTERAAEDADRKTR